MRGNSPSIVTIYPYLVLGLATPPRMLLALKIPLDIWQGSARG